MKKRFADVDDATQDAVAIVPQRAISGHALTRILDQLSLTRRLPKVIRTDKRGSEARHQVLRSLRPLAAEQQREYPWIAVSVPDQGHGSVARGPMPNGTTSPGS